MTGGIRHHAADDRDCRDSFGEGPVFTYRWWPLNFMSEEGLLMTPRRTDTDGFYVSMLVRAAGGA